MDRRIIIAAVVIFIFAILGFLAYNNLEIYQRKRYTAPSREVSENIYRAMELWLKETGHNVRSETSFNSDRLKDITEKVLIVQSTAYDWRTTDGIKQWIENGGCFVLCLDLSNNFINDNLSGFLSDFGITAEYNQPLISFLNRTQEDEETEFLNDITDNENADSVNDASYVAENPVFQTRVSLIIENEEDFYLIKNNFDAIRLAEIKIGDGALTVLGMPVFMYNYSLTRESNANLSWQLTGGRTDADNRGILFVRVQSRNANNSVFAAVIERGNLIPVLVSVIILLIIGFWMVVPVFGLTLKEKTSVSRPITDRFTAEIQFLKKHHSLDYYLNIYKSGQKSEDENKKEKLYDYKETVNDIKTAQEKIYGIRKS